VYRKLGRYAEAAPLYETALAIFEQANAQAEVATALNNLAGLYQNQGREAEAEPLYLRAIAIREEVLGPDQAPLAVALSNLASFYRDQDRHGDALPLAERAIAIFEREFPQGHALLATVLHNLAAIHEEERRYDEAERLYARSLAMRETLLGSRHPDLAASLTALASVKWSDRANAAEVLPLLDRAIGILETTLASPQFLLSAHVVRARVRKGRGEADAAFADMRAAIQIAEELRPQAGGAEETRAEFFERYRSTFDLMAAWQIEAGDVERALEYVERGRARAFLDQLAAGKIDLMRDVPAEERAALGARERAARARVSEYQQRITLLRSRRDLTDEARSRQLDLLGDSLRLADQEFRRVYDEMKTRSPLWRDVVTSGGQPVPLGTLQRRVAPARGLMLVYRIGTEGSHVFVIPPAGEAPSGFELRVADDVAATLRVQPGALTSSVLASLIGADAPAPTGQVPERAGNAIALLSRHPGERGIGTANAALSVTRLHALWELLVPESIRARVRAATEVVVVPDAALHQVPFEALVIEPGSTPANTRYWLDVGPPVRYAPSATVLHSIEQRPSTRSPIAGSGALLTLSDPIYDPAEVARESAAAADTARGAAGVVTRSSYVRAGGPLTRLPGTAAETDAVRDAFGAVPSLGGVRVLQRLDATEPNLRGGMAGTRYLHIATHGVVDERRGALFAALATTPPAGADVLPEHDGFLQLHEIYSMQLAEVALAVLSACATNVGSLVDGEGVFALSRGFLAAGARRVVASQWAVEDRSTAELMGRFFRGIAEAEQRGERVEYARLLRDAKRALRERAEWADPYFWAPFVLTGSR
jgi:CHAT domain-containing protein